MRIIEALRHPTAHTSLTNVTVDQHHDQPENIAVSNTSQLIDPLPGGPGIWDIAVPLNANVVTFNFRSIKIVEEGGAKAGVTGIANRNILQPATFSHDGVQAEEHRGAFYAKTGGALNLSHKVFSSLGDDIALSDMYMLLTSSTTRVLRTYWTNYGVAQRTLSVTGQVQVIG